ncbi:MAG TPA: hypothetical protein GXX75_08130 [Clostridiales bacterium]|nr:hypothetical protein [Clostridiales bacterium]
MSVKPIDLMKLQEASQYKHMEIQRQQHAQEASSQNFQSMIANQHKKPQETTKSENLELHYDAKEKGSNEYVGSRGQKRKGKKEDKKDKEPPKRGGFDVLI